jgi:phosphoglycerate dehydrogenase-like enzyme
MKAIIQKNLFERARDCFEASQLTWLVHDVTDEAGMIRTQRETGARCFVIGADRYSDSFYSSIHEGSLVVRFGVGYDSVPLDLCKQRGILVAYTPGTLDHSVAEHTMGLMLSAARGICTADRLVKSGVWRGFQGIELRGKVLAVVGFGKIGRTVAAIAKHGFGMQISAFDVFPELDPEYATLVDRYSWDFPTAVKGADFVSLHLSVNDSTIGFIDRARLDAMERRSILINTSRGRLINEADLFDALSERRIAGAALDVFCDEPSRSTSSTV